MLISLVNPVKCLKDGIILKSVLTVKIDFILEIKLVLNACIVDDGVELYGMSNILRVSVNLLTSGYFCTMLFANFFRLLLSVFISNSTVSSPYFASSSSLLLRLPTAITRGLLGSLARARARARPMPAVAPVTRMHLLSSMEGIMCRSGQVTRLTISRKLLRILDDVGLASAQSPRHGH